MLVFGSHLVPVFPVLRGFPNCRLLSLRLNVLMHCDVCILQGMLGHKLDDNIQSATLPHLLSPI